MTSPVLSQSFQRQVIGVTVQQRPACHSQRQVKVKKKKKDDLIDDASVTTWQNKVIRVIHLRKTI